MFKVECPGCQAPYQVDERRVPPTGLKMRCPKCGSSFQVDAPTDPRRTGPSPVLVGGFSSVDAPDDQRAKPPRPARPNLPKSRLGTLAGVAPAPAMPTTRQQPTVPAADPYGEVDLPTVGGARNPDASRAATVPGAFELDEPAPASAPPSLDDLDMGLDLPAVSQAARAAPQPAADRFGEFDLDLPARMGPSSPPSRADMPAFGEIDLPVRSRAGPSGALADRLQDFDLPLRSARQHGSSSRPSGGRDDLDLPSPSAALPSPSFELPSPSAALPSRSRDLPSPSAALPSRSRDLPSPSAALPSRAADLPVPSPTAALPSPAGGRSNLPATAEAGRHLPSARTDLPSSASALPSVRGPDYHLPPASAPGSLPPAFGLNERPSYGGAPSVPPEYEEHAQTFRSSPPPSAGFGEVDLPPLQLSRPPPSMTSAATVAAPRTSATATGVVRQADGGVNYGEVNLDGGDTSSFDADGDGDGDPRRHDEDMEFGAIPQQAPTYSRAPTALATARTELAPAARPVAPTEPMSPTRPRSRRTTRVVAASLATVVIAGGALALVPAVGPFGAYWVSDQLKRREHESLVQSTVQRARAALRQDTHRAAASAASAVDGARTSAPRVKALPAYAAFIGYLRELRFGAHAATRARAQVGLDELADAHDGDVAHLQLARAARAAVQGQLARARAEVGALAQKNARDVDALVLAGELELRGSDARAALSAWQRAAAVEPGPRTAFGLARAHRALGDEPRAVEHAEAALKANPEHVGGKVLIAEVIWRARHDETRALALLDSVVKQPAAASAQELVSAFTVLGDVHLERSRISHAEAAYGNALKIDPKAAGALNGLGDALFRAGRYSEALARYEAAAQADPDDLAAKVGVAKAKLALEQLQDSLEMLKKLREGNAKSLLVNYWYGRAQEAAGDRPSAEAAYRAAIALEGGEQTLVDAYVALALLLNQLGRGEEAQKLLAEAKTKLKSSPAVHKALGELALQQGRDAAAIESFQRALELDPADVGATFRLGIALRRTRRFDEANRMLDAVSAVDRDFPGLALERGLLYESSGRSEEALKAYEGALAKAPNDVDLMLRVGCSKVIGGRPEQAVELLRKVLVQRPSSAETNHCLGRGLLLEGNNLAEALRLLERAVELDPHRAEHHLYVGWAANEAGRVAQAERSLAQALTIDQGLGDAYWQRGLLRYRQGAVKDAVEDLRRALELSPSRFEAHAALADSLYDLGREPDAIREWQAAVQAQPDNPTWRFRYGKLLAINHRNNEAREHLAKAIEVGEQQDSKPRWLWEAHHLIARAYGGTKEAVRHWEEFLKLGPRDSPYRSEAKAALEKLGRPYTGD